MSVENKSAGEQFITDDFSSEQQKISSNGCGKPFKLNDEAPSMTDEDGWMDILGSGDLKKRVIKNGNGVKMRPVRGNWVTLNINCKLLSGTVVEESANFRVILGDNDIIQGLEIAVSLMELNEVAQVIVPSRLAYGELGRLPDIPANTSLNYELELVAIEESVDEKDLPFSQRQAIGNAKRERGNFWHTRGDYSTAIHCYRRALDFLVHENENLVEPVAELQEFLELRLKVHNNLAASQLKIEAYEAAMKSVDFVLKVQPNNVKALFRKGKIFAAKGENEDAIEILKKALKLNPGTKIIHQELSKLQSRKRIDDRREKAMYKRMFGQNTPITRRPSKMRSWLQKLGLLLGSMVVAAVGVVVYKHVHSSH